MQGHLNKKKMQWQELFLKRKCIQDILRRVILVIKLTSNRYKIIQYKREGQCVDKSSYRQWNKE